METSCRPKKTLDIFRCPAPHWLAPIFLVAFLTPALGTADWSIDPVLRGGFEYDDNARLNFRTDEEVKLSGYLVEANADFVYTSERTTFNALPRILYRKYPDEPDFDSTDLFLRSRFEHRMKASTVGFRLNLDHQQVRTAERADADLTAEESGDITGDDSGRVFLTGDRTRWIFVPNWTYEFSEVSSVAADIEYFDVSYQDVFMDLLHDYNDARLNFSYRRNMSNVSTFIATGTTRKFTSDDPVVSDVTGYGAQIGFARELSQTSSLNAMIGVEDSDLGTVSVDPEVVGNITYVRRLEIIRLFAQYRRSVNASGAGRLSVRDQINVNFTRRLNEKITAGIGIRGYTSSGLGEGVSVDDRDYVQLLTQFRWYLNPSFSIEADYRYTILDRGQTLGERANSNHVVLWFVYQPNSLGR